MSNTPAYNHHMSFADRLKQAMMTAQMTQTELSRLTGITQATISRTSRGVHIPSIALVERIEEVLPNLRELRDKELRRAS